MEPVDTAAAVVELAAAAADVIPVAVDPAVSAEDEAPVELFEAEYQNHKSTVV